MKSSRRIKRMSRNRAKAVKMNLTSLMDVFTILVFFLLVNSATTEVLETPKQITLPASVVEEKPRETVVVFISPSQVTVQGESVASIDEILGAGTQDIPSIAQRLAELSASVIGVSFPCGILHASDATSSRKLSLPNCTPIVPVLPFLAIVPCPFGLLRHSLHTISPPRRTTAATCCHWLTTSAPGRDCTVPLCWFSAVAVSMRRIPWSFGMSSNQPCVYP